MTKNNLEQYQSRVEELGQALLDVIASVSLGNFNVQVDIPDDIEVFSDLAVGLEFMIEDLRELARDQERARSELEQKITERTRELESTLGNLQIAQRQMVSEGWEDYTQTNQNNTLTLNSETGLQETQTWIPGMEKALKQKKTALESNGQNTQTLSLPIQLQDEIIGVIGFNRSADQPWNPREIATVEAIAEQVGLALENQRLFDRTQAALAEADTLYKATAELNTAQSYNDILKVIKKFSQLGQSATQLHIGVFNTQNTQIELPEHILLIAGLPEEANADLPRRYNLPDFSALVEKKILSPNNITLLDNIEAAVLLPEGFRAAYSVYMGAKAVAFIPLLVGGQWIGFIDCVYPMPTSFSEEDFKRTTALSAQASVAIQNIRSIQLAEQRAQEAQKRSEELALINRVVSSVTAAPDLQQSLKLVAKEMNKAVSVDETFIALANQSNESMDLVAFDSILPNLPTMEGGLIPVRGNPPVSHVVNTRKPLLISINDEGITATPMHELMDYRKYNLLLLMPLITGSDVIGIIGMGLQSQDDSIDQAEMRLAETILLQASTAIQNARLLNQTQAALTETASLYQANKDLNSAQTYDDILAVLQKHTLLGQKSTYSGIFLFETPTTPGNQPESLKPIAQWSVVETQKLPDESLSAEIWPTGEDFMHPDSLTFLTELAGNAKLPEHFTDFIVRQQKAKTVLCAPLAVAGRWVGQVYASYPTKPNFSESDQRRLMALSGQAATAIENIGLLEETARRANQLETAAEIAQQASSTLDTGALLNRAVNLIRDRFGFYHSSIFLLDGSTAKVAASTGEAGRQLIESGHSLEIRQGGSIIGSVCSSGTPLIVNDVAKNPTHRPHPLLPDTRAEMGIPLKIGNRVTGALDVQSTQANAFSDDDVAVLQTLADQIAIALDNARSFEIAQQAVEEMREVDRLKSEFLANMSHELRTPLNSIIGFSRVILKGIDGPINDLQQQDLEAIHHSGQHLLDMINNILDLSKIEAGKMELSIEEIQLPDILDSVIATARGLVKEKPIKLISSIPENFPQVSADRTRVRQILLNLLQNAAKFTEEGTITVSVDRLPNSPFAKIAVIDTGIGIAKADQDKLFERFSQVDSSLTRKVGGTGLGLSITRALVDMQGGRIDLESIEGKGTTFWFTLPLVGEEIQSAQELEEFDLDPDAKVIVSIDDDKKVIDLYKRYLGSHGYQVIAITNPNEVIEQLKRIKPFAITLDIMMPNKDGWQVIQEIKEDPETAKIPVIICSIVEDRDRAYKLGAVDYLVKPILEEELVDAIKRLKLPETEEFVDILVVDDDPNVFQLVEIALRDETQYQLSYANGGFAGIERIKHKPPHVIILDLMMPDLDGFSILETMQGEPHLRDIPVIILTAADLGPEERKTLANLRKEVLKKDEFKSEQLIDHLDHALQELHQQTKE